MAFRLSEPAATAIAGRLVADLPAAIAARNAEITDGFTLAEPGEVFPFVPGPKRLSVVGYEAIGIGRLKTEFQNDIGTHVTGTHDLPILAYLADPDADMLAPGDDVSAIRWSMWTTSRDSTPTSAARSPRHSASTVTRRRHGRWRRAFRASRAGGPVRAVRMRKPLASQDAKGFPRTRVPQLMGT
jgi:hypothetical protein